MNNNIRQNAPTVIVQKLFGRCPKENPQLRNCLGCSSGRCPMTNGPLPQQNAEDFALDRAYPLPFPPSSPPPPHSASIHTIEVKRVNFGGAGTLIFTASGPQWKQYPMFQCCQGKQWDLSMIKPRSLELVKIATRFLKSTNQLVSINYLWTNYSVHLPPGRMATVVLVICIISLKGTVDPKPQEGLWSR